MFAPSTAHNACSMVDGRTYTTHLHELGEYLDAGGTIKEPMNEVAYGTTRVFLEIDGPFTPEIEDSMFYHLMSFRTADGACKYDTYDPATWRRCVLRCGDRNHVVFEGLVLPIADYSTLIDKVRRDHPTVDKTCNGDKAWMRFPTSPKPGDRPRPYRLVDGPSYKSAFINPHPVPARKAVKVNVQTVVGSEDMARILAKWPGTVLAKRGYVEPDRRVYFSRGKAWCEAGQRWHSKRPVVYVVGDTVRQGRCNDPLCK